MDKNGPSREDIEALFEIGAEIARLRERRDAIQKLIESKSARRRRTVNVVVSTVLTAGSLFGAVITPWTLIATPIGFIRWVRTIENDSAQENRQAGLRRELSELERNIHDVETNYLALKRRIG